jgi:hypothetical protein
MTLDDASHYTAEDKARIVPNIRHERATVLAAYPPWEAACVCRGEKLLVEPFSASHWVKLGGMDFGYDHPAAFVGSVDRDLDCIYLVRTLRLRHQTPLQHVKLSDIGDYVGPGRMITTTDAAGAGVPLMRQYKDAGLT